MDESLSSLNQVQEVKVKETKSMKKIIPIILIVLVIGAGIFTGYMIAGRTKKSAVSEGVVPAGQIVKGQEFGAKDASTFKDTATGVLEKGGIDGEGTHNLVRDGGPSQTAYLTSSVLDLDQFVGKKVQVWGETLQSQKAGWLMDVGRVKILE